MVVRNRKRTTRWNLIFRYTSLIMAMVQGLVMVPLYLRFIPINIYGAWLASGNLLAWISTMDPGLTAVLQQQIAMAYGKNDLKLVKTLIGSGLIISLIVLFIAISFGLVSAHYLPFILNSPTSVDLLLILKAFKLAVIGTSLMLFSFSISAINQGLQGSLSLGIISNGIAVSSIGLTILLLLLDYGLMALPISLIFSGISFTLGQSLYLIWRIVDEKIGISFSLKKIKYIAKLLTYTFMGRAGSIISNNVDLLIVARYLGPETVAIYSLTKKPIEISREFINQPVVAFMPAVSHLKGTTEKEKTKNIILRLCSILIWMIFLITGGMISFNSYFVHLWVGSHLFAGSTINFIICFSALIVIITQSAGYLSFSLGNIKINSLASFVQSILYILLVIIGTKYYGLYGAVIAPMLSILSITFWYYPKSIAKQLKLKRIDIKKIFCEVLLAFIAITPVTFGFSFLSPKNWFSFILFVVLFCLIYAAILFALSARFRTEVKGIVTTRLINISYNNE